MMRAALLLSLAIAASTHAQAQTTDAAGTDFLRGKTVTFLIGTAPGGAADIMGRIVARELPKHLPGQPTLIVQNMAGAGSINMVNHLYNRAPKDGTTFGLPISSVLLEQKLKTFTASGGNVGFDINQIQWIGSPSNQPVVMWVWNETPIKSFQELVNGPELIFGAPSPGTDGYVVPLLTNRMMNTNIKIVSGYKALMDIFLAAERREVQGNVAPLYTVTVGRRDDYKSGKIRILAQFGLERLDLLPEIPTGIELAQDDESKLLLKLWATKFEAAYPLGLPPGVPKDRVEAYRRAFDQTMQDPAFRELTSKADIDISPKSGSDIQKMVAALMSTDDAYFQKLLALMSP